MTAHPPEGLQRLLDEAPFVRLLAQTLLAEEADDVVQQTWLHAVQHGGNEVAEPRSWLARIARNVASNLRRGGDRRRRHEDGAAAAPPVPSSAELMAREEQRRALVHAVDRLPAPLRTVVLLRFFDGLPPRRIAKELGLPVTTVGNQLRRALQLLRERLDAEHGGQRRAWLLPLVPFAMEPRGLPAPDLGAATLSALGTGAIITMNTKLVAGSAAALVAAAGIVWWLMNDGEPHRGIAPERVRDTAVVASAELPVDALAADTVASQRSEVAAAPANDAAKTGSLVVRVRWGDDQTPAAGVALTVGRYPTDTRVDGRRAITDAAGTVRFDDLPPEPSFGIASTRTSPPKIVAIRAGETTELDLELPIGLLLTGIVVDAANTPVAGALVEIEPFSHWNVVAEVLATTDAAGRFTVRGAPVEVMVGARANGHGASAVKFVAGKDGNPADVRLQLGPRAGSIAGVVVDEAHAPIAGALVRIGAPPERRSAVRDDGTTRLPALVRSDELGRFRAIGVAPGTHAVVARAAGRAAWTGTCEVIASAATPLHIRLERGALLHGVVCDAGGAPIARANVEVGDWADLDHFRTSTASDGTFRLVGLRAGEVDVRASHHDHGEAKERVTTAAGRASSCELRLSPGLVLRGRVEDENGAPLAKARLECVAEGAPTWGRHLNVGDEGRFAILNCPAGALLTLTARKDGFEDLRRVGIVPSAELIVLRLVRAVPPTARITGIVAGPDGQPIPNAGISILRPNVTNQSGVLRTGPDGRFESGPIVPGTWRVFVHTSEHPHFRSEPHELTANATWDIGTIRLSASGRAAIAIDGDRTGVSLSIRSPEPQSWASVNERDGALVSQPLAPGEHRLLVSGANVAAQSIPFTVRAGETTNVAVKLVPGVRQRVELTTNTLDPLPPYGISVRVHRGDELLTATGFVPDPTKPVLVELCLPRGNFTLTAITADRELVRTPFTVGASEGPPLQLTLR